MKYLNWCCLVDDLQRILVMNQTQLAEKCKVTQQSVSNWKTGLRSPGVYARSVLRDLCKEAKIKSDSYKVSHYQQSDLPEDILAFAELLMVLPKRKRDKIMDMAEFIINKS